MAAPYGVLWPCVLRYLGVAGFTVATPRLITVMWVQILRERSWPFARGRLLGVSLLVDGFLESALSWLSSREFRVGPPSGSRPMRQLTKGRRPHALGA